MVNILIWCMIAFLPLYTRISSVNIDRISKTNALLCLLPLVIILFSEKLRSFNKGLAAIFCVAILHLVFFQYEPASIWGFYQSISICLGLLFIAKYNENFIESDKDLLQNFLCIGALIQSFVAILQFFNIDVYNSLIFFLNKDVESHGAYVSGHKAIFGTLGNPNILGAYLALCLPAFFRSNAYLCMAIPVGIAIGLSGSLIPIATSFIVGAYFFAPSFKGKDLLVYAIIPICFYAFCFYYPHLTSDRSEIWAWYLSKIDLAHALIGKSTSWLPMNVMPLRSGTVDNVHNEFLTAFNIFGMSAIIAIGCMVRLISKNISKDKVFASIFVAAFILSLGSFPMHMAPTAIIIMVAIAHCLKGSYVGHMDR
jgi:hypothetical protein